MGLVTKNNKYDLDESISMFFSVPEESQTDYEELKTKIYDLDIDNEEKANIISTINSINNNYLQKADIIEKIDRFKNKYNL